MLVEMEEALRAEMEEKQRGRQEQAYYKEKYEQMQLVIEGCSSQIQEFDQVNSMSCELIERL